MTPRECVCTHMDHEHEQGDDRFGACLVCGCEGMEASVLSRPSTIRAVVFHSTPLSPAGQRAHDYMQGLRREAEKEASSGRGSEPIVTVFDPWWVR